MENRSFAASLPTSAGIFVATFEGDALVRLRFPPVQTSVAPVAEERSKLVRLTLHAIEECLAGRAPAQFPPLDFAAGSAFQHQVWAALQSIPCGQVSSYGRIAKLIGAPKAARAVGAACGANPIPLFIPCHRVLAGDGTLGGFSGGLDWKRRLLAAEGSWPSRDRPRQGILSLCVD